MKEISRTYRSKALFLTQKTDGNAVQNYIQKYTYDEVGNFLELQHIAGSASYTRTYDIAINSNRLRTTRVGTDVYDYTYDLRGNMTAMPYLSDMLWNTQNELKQITRGADATYYQYSGGQRVRKYTDKGTVKEERIYLGSFELYRKFDSSGNIDIERSTVHVSDDTGRIAMLETLHPDYNSDGSEPVLTRYCESNEKWQ